MLSVTSGRISYSLQAASDSAAVLREIPIMVSLIQKGTVLMQEETFIPYSGSFESVPVGVSEMRFQGDGVVTLLKRGLQVTDGQITTVQAVLRSGPGSHVVDYGGIAPEGDLAVRLDKLERGLANPEGLLSPEQVVERLEKLFELLARVDRAETLDELVNRLGTVEQTSVELDARITQVEASVARLSK